jgi:hypothetical protein
MFVNIPLARVTSPSSTPEEVPLVNITGVIYDKANRSVGCKLTFPPVRDDHNQSKKTSLEEITSEQATKVIGRGQAFVEMHPPTDNRVCRMVSIDEHNVAGTLENFNLEGDILTGDSRPLNKKVCDLFSSGQVSFGMRSYRDEDNKPVIVTWDLVPSSTQPNEA